MILGITGKIGSGKSTLAKQIQDIGLEEWQKTPLSNSYKMYNINEKNTSFSKENSEIIELDEIGHHVLQKKEVVEKLVKVFDGIILKEGKIHRRTLGKIVFSEEENLGILESIVHPFMRNILTKKIFEYQEKGSSILLVGALAKTFHFDKMCQQIIVVDVSKEKAWERIQKRNPEMEKMSFNKVWERQEKEAIL